MYVKYRHAIFLHKVDRVANESLSFTCLELVHGIREKTILSNLQSDMTYCTGNVLPKFASFESISVAS